MVRRSESEAFTASLMKTQSVNKTGHGSLDFLRVRGFSDNMLVKTLTGTMADVQPLHPEQDITQLLRDWGRGERSALDRLVPLVHHELKRIARNFMRRQDPGHTLQTTALVNEAFLNLVGSSRVNWQSRTHFFAIAAQLMRRVLVDSARRRNSRKRGGDQLRVTFDGVDVAPETSTDLVALDEALTRLSELNPRHGRIVELKYFGGLTEEQISHMLNISERTVRRDWTLAKTWLFRELKSADPS
jgi:RNA polymerase sigma-70 factor (ECF subfamily)